MNNNNNFIVAVVLSLAILLGFHYLYEVPRAENVRQQQALKKIVETEKVEAAKNIEAVKALPREEVIKKTHRIKIETPEYRGSINLKGGRIDDIALIKYRESTEKNSPEIMLLSPAGSIEPRTAYYAEFGWLGEGAPDSESEWKADSEKLTPASPVKMTWTNKGGIVFERTISVDDNFMFTIKDKVRNGGAEPTALYPYGLISRRGKPHTDDTYVLHEGPLGVFNGTLQEYKYKELMEASPKIAESEGGWLGITDKYWLVALIPNSGEKITAKFSYDLAGAENPEKGVFQTDFRGAQITVGQGAEIERTANFFAGAKRVRILDAYGEKYGIDHFDRAIDFGWYYFLTKPFLYMLDYFGQWLGNYGLAIILFTVILKILTVPLSVKSYRSMAKMKALQPELKRIQEKYAQDKQRQGMETMELYKREKVNPMSGCVPMLIQIPIFFALYKVLYVGIEMRQAPLFGWVRDLSDYDHTSVLTLFGLVDWSFIPHIGVWPILMGISMYLQQSLSPQPPDKTQAQVFKFLPLMFTFMMAKVAVGLIFYWTVSNLIGIAQQWYVMRKVGGHKT